MPPDPAVWPPHFHRVKTPRLLSATPLMTHFSQSRPKLANEEIDFYYPLRSSLNYMKQNKTMGGKKRKKKKEKTREPLNSSRCPSGLFVPWSVRGAMVYAGHEPGGKLGDVALNWDFTV